MIQTHSLESLLQANLPDGFNLLTDNCVYYMSLITRGHIIKKRYSNNTT